jgi:hypothetical protein
MPPLYSGELAHSLVLPIIISLRYNDLRHEEHCANPFRKLAQFDGARTYVKFGVTYYLRSGCYLLLRNR